MPLDPGYDDIAARAAGLNRRYRHHAATEVLERALTDPAVGRVAMVSSFGAESVALLHIVSVIDRSTPVLFIDTQMLFQETLDYQTEVAEKLGLRDVRRIRPRALDVATEDRDGTLNQRITGRKRYQSSTRATLDFFEPDGVHRLKINPLAHWTSQDVQDYMVNNRLPRHPLVAKGYPSLGCAPCTSPVAPGEDPRAGRWRGQTKEECGIHFAGGRIVRGTPAEEDAA